MRLKSRYSPSVPRGTRFFSAGRGQRRRQETGLAGDWVRTEKAPLITKTLPGVDVEALGNSRQHEGLTARCLSLAVAAICDLRKYLQKTGREYAKFCISSGIAEWLNLARLSFALENRL